jgi:hypothetical protein
MSSPNSIKLISSILFASLLFVGCQKSTPRSIKVQVGSGDQSVDTLSKEDKKVDEAVRGDKIIECSEEFLKKQKILMAEIEKTNQFLTDNKGKKLDAATEKEMTDRSLAFKKQSDVLVAELVKAEAAGCKEEKKFLIIDIKNKVNVTIIAVADLIGKDNSASTAAREEKKRFDKNLQRLSLVGQSFEVSKELIDSLVNESVEQNLHVVEGIIGLGKTNFDLAVKDNKKTVCLLTKAPQKKLGEKAKITILDVSTSITEKIEDPESLKVLKFMTMSIGASCKDQVIAFACQLAADAASNLKDREFKKAFGELLK